MNELMQQAREISHKLGTKCLVVGGFVRDRVIGFESKDLDMEVYGLSFDDIKKLLDTHFKISEVGREFGIIKVDNCIDVSIPRRDNRVGVGHTDFACSFDPSMTPREAASRRDFTMNSLAMDMGGNIIDPFNGVKDIENQIIRATSPAYKEDALRVLRGMKFASRFGFDMDPDTIVMSYDMLANASHISVERIWNEWKDWARGPFPSNGLRLLVHTGWISLFPEIEALLMTEQDPIWHPEGNAFEHTAHVCDAAADICIRDDLFGEEQLVALMAALLHDVGKATTTVKNDQGRWISPKHAPEGVPIAKEFLSRLRAPKHIIDHVLPLVAEHMVHVRSGKFSREPGPPSLRTVRRLSYRLHPATMQQWSRVCEADHSGRPPLEKKNPVLDWMVVAEQLRVENEKPEPILLGRHLLGADLVKPGPQMGEILKRVFEAQLDGEVLSIDDCLEKAKEIIDGEGFKA